MSVAAHCSAADALTEALQKGLFEEEANQNLEAAIKAYQDVLARADEQRRVAATALFRLAECYRKQGKTNEATAEYRRLVRDYTDQSTLVNLSRQNLIGLGSTPTIASATATSQNPEALSTDEEQQEIQAIRALIQNSPDLINAKSRGLAPPGPSYAVGTVLHQAAFKGHLLVAEYLLANGAQVNALDSRNQTALYHAAHNGHKRMVELLLSKYARPSLGNNLPLHAVAERGFVGVAEVLLANKADVNAVRQGKTALHVAIDKKNLQVAELLLKNGADVNAIYPRGKVTSQPTNPLHSLGSLDGTPLHFAVQNQNVEAAKMLLAKQADATARSGAGLTPLHSVAAADGNNALQMAKMLIEAGAKVDAAGTEDGDLPGWTPLHIAVFHKRPEIAALLLEKSADPNLFLPAQLGNERTALNIAMSGGVSEIVELLLTHKADVNARDHNGDTPLLRAVREQNQPMVELLLSNQADPSALDAQGFPPLQLALGARLQNSSVTMVPPIGPPRLGSPAPASRNQPTNWLAIPELLLKHKADPNQRDKVKDKESETALHLAARRTDQDAVELLLKYKADPNARTDSGMTPLHWASNNGLLIDLLLTHKADPNATDAAGQTPFHRAVNNADTNTFARLVKAGADINACTRGGDTPLRTIIRTRGIDQPKEFAAIQFLLNLGADVTKSCDGNSSALEVALTYKSSGLVDLFRKHHSKKLAVVTFEGPVAKPGWFWEADKTVTLSEAIAAVGLQDTADPTRITILRSDRDTGLTKGERHNLIFIREKFDGIKDPPLKHGDKITVGVRTD